MIGASVLFATVENVLNRGLPRSPRAQQLCAELAGRRIVVEISNVATVLVLSTGVCLKVTALDAGAATQASTAETRIVGGPFSLLALTGSSPEAVLQRGQVRIEGDTELAQKFRELVLLLRPDPEEELSYVLGDVPAHQIGRVTRTALGWSRRAASTAIRNLAEYLGHERRDLVPATEAEDFFGSVDALREDVDRLEARLALLSSRRGGGHVDPRARDIDPRDA